MTDKTKQTPSPAIPAQSGIDTAAIPLVSDAELLARTQPLPTWIDNMKGSDPTTDSLIEYIEQLRAAHPVQQPAPVAGQEPVAHVLEHCGGEYSNLFFQRASAERFVKQDDMEVKIVPLYAAPVPAASVQPQVMRKCHRFGHRCNCLTECPATGEVGGPAQPSMQPDGPDLSGKAAVERLFGHRPTTTTKQSNSRRDAALVDVKALAWKWHREAVKQGFACSEPAQELFEVLGWPAHPANVAQVGELSDAKLLDWLESQDHLHALRWSNNDGYWFGIYDRDRNVRGTGITLRAAIIAAMSAPALSKGGA